MDAASSSGCLGIQETETDTYLSNFINLETPVHCIIYDKKLPYESSKFYTNFPKEVKKFSLPATIPPNVNKLDPMHGFTKQNWYDSLFWSIISQMVLYNYKIPTSVNELRKLATTELKKGILAIKLKDSIFNNVHSDYRTYLQEFENEASRWNRTSSSSMPWPELYTTASSSSMTTKKRQVSQNKLFVLTL